MTSLFVALVAATISGPAAAQEAPLEFTSVATVFVRSPDPIKLAQFYEAIGFKKARTTARGATLFFLEGSASLLEVMQMDPAAKPVMGKTSRTQQGVVPLIETNNPAEVARRAKAAGATLVEKYDSQENPITLYYIGDPENNIIGFAPRHHNPEVKSP